MSQTTVRNGDSVAIKQYSVALFVQTQKTPSAMKNLTGPAPSQSDAEKKLKLQTSPDMPIVRVQDLARTAGDTVSVDCVNITSGKPIMGDRDAEGKGEKLSFSSMDVKIDLATKPIDAGGKMSQQRTRHQLRGLALANASGYMARLESQLCHIHLAGARGELNYQTWPIPLATDPDFAEIVVNSVKAPTYNRHYVVSGSGTTVTKGGVQLASIATADVMKLDVLDALRLILDEMELPMQPVKIADDDAANDDPMWVLLCPPRVFDSLKTASGSNLRTFQQNAWNRASYGSKHPLFRGEVGMWNGILVKKVNDFWVRFAGGSSVAHITAANEATATETNVTVAALGGGTHAVERCLLLGAQALANTYGRSQSSDYHYTWLERKYNFNRGLEIATEMMGGKAKLRFDVPQPDGSKIPTDHGVLALDVAVKL
jgi:N4-gp56 family major capsid protein